MKKTIIFAAVTAAVLFAASCTVGPAGPQGADGAVVMFQNGVYPSSSYAGCEDNGMISSDPAANYGASTIIGAVGVWSGSEKYRYKIKFDVSYIVPSNVNVTEAYLELVPWQTVGVNTITAYALTKNWVEMQANWNIYSTGNSWAVPGGDYSAGAVSGTMSYGLGDLNKTCRIKLNNDTVKSWITNPSYNYGVILIASNETAGTAYFNPETSENADPLKRPRLIIKYTLPQ